MYVPKTYWDTRQTFSFVISGAPDLMGPPAKYMPAIDSLLDALLQGIANVCQSQTLPEALVLLGRSRDQVRAARERFRDGRPDEGRILLHEAEAGFVEAGRITRRARFGAAGMEPDAG